MVSRAPRSETQGRAGDAPGYRMRSVRNCLTARLSHTASTQSSFSRERKRFTRIFSSLSAVFLRRSLVVSCFMGCAFLKMSHPWRSLFLLSRVRLSSASVSPCVYFVRVRGLRCRVGAAARSFKDGLKAYSLNFETGAGVKYKSSSAPACVISGRLIYPSSPSGQRSDFTNPKTCSCSSMSFSMIHQSQPFKK